MYLDLKSVISKLCVSKNTIWRWSREGNFPKPVRLGVRTTRWLLSDVEAWEQRRKHADGA
jgi:prophage regulatory protein